LDLIGIILLIGFIETVILFLYSLRWYIFTVASFRSAKFRSQPTGGNKLENVFVSVLLPIFNEPNVVDRLLKACTSFKTPPYEVIVIDDSDDQLTGQRLARWSSHPKVKVAHRGTRRGWKGEALNFGLDHTDPKSTHVMVFDADFVPSEDLIDRFLERFPEGAAAVQGYQKHDLNVDENWVTRGVRVWHSLYNMIEVNGLDRVGNYVPLTGCVYMIKTDILRKLRFRGVITEDTDLSLRLFENGYKISFEPTLSASGECPSTLKRLVRQQMRWAEGHTRVFRKHFLSILRCKFLSLIDKVNFFLIGFSFLNSVLVAILMGTWLMTSLFPSYFLPIPVVVAGLLFFFASVPSGILASLVALSLEGAKKDFGKIANAWVLNALLTPVIAYASLKGLLTNDEVFHRTFKSGKIANELASSSSCSS
jgi:cellulose synthase/poly-beta-1,6-N-acetylglucosamine synthase-like glycosyltransferase